MRAILIATLSLCAACGVEREPGVIADQDTAPQPDAGLSHPDSGAATDADVPSALDDATGQWALFVEDRKCLAALGTEVESLIWSVYLVDVVDPGGPAPRVVDQRIELCTQSISPLVGGLVTVVPQAIPEHLPTRQSAAWLLNDDTPAAYLSDAWSDLWGADGVSTHEALPQTIDDPRLVDVDDDGEPGVTFVVATARGDAVCEVRVVQRTTLRLRGAVVNAHRIEGAVESQVEKVVLEASTALCDGDNPYVDSRNPSRFNMARVDGGQGALNLDLDRDGAITCAELLDAQAVLGALDGMTRSEPDDDACR